MTETLSYEFSDRMIEKATLVLIGCSKSKQYTYDRKVGGRVLPEDLYTGALFKKRVEYAESRGLAWAVLSAQFGVWENHVLLKPAVRSEDGRNWVAYNTTMKNLSKSDKAAWLTGVCNSVVNYLWEPFDEAGKDPWKPAQFTIEIHAGSNYRTPLDSMLKILGFNVKTFCEGLGIGEQLKAYTSGELKPLCQTK